MYILALAAVFCCISIEILAQDVKEKLGDPLPFRGNFPERQEYMQGPLMDWEKYMVRDAILDSQNLADPWASSDNRKWSNGLNIQIDPAFAYSQYAYLHTKIHTLSQYMKDCLNVNILPRTQSNPSGDYIFIQKGATGSGCWADIGRRGGKQLINLEVPFCINVGGIVEHELGHALGLYHEHNRMDRDFLVKIEYENISPQYQSFFIKSSNVKAYNTGYDYESVMHLGGKAFSANGKPTIRAINGVEVGSKGFFTIKDRQKLRNMYCPS